MRLWLLVAGDFVRTGGMDAANFALAGHLAHSGRPTHLVAHRVDPELAAIPGVVVHRVPRPLGSHLLGFPLLDRAGRRAAREVASAGGVVLANGGNVRGAAATWLHYVHAAYAPRIAGRPLRRAAESFARRRALADERAVARDARVVICNSQLTAGHAVELLGADPARVHTVYYGADPRFTPPSEDERRDARAALGLDDGRPAVAFVGALGDRRKGFDALFAAWKALAGDGDWDARLIVVGAGGELEAWRARAAAAGLGDSVRFAGFQPDVRRVLVACDAIVSPARYEAYGLAVQEAACMGLMPIVSRHAGVAERVPAALAPLLIADPEDAGEVAARLRAWQAEREAYRAHAADFAAALHAWTWDDMAGRIVDILERAA